MSTSPNVPFTVVDIDTTLRLFRIWETFWTTSSCPRNVTGYDPREDLGYLWRDVWFVYYLTLSDILQRGWVYDSEHTPDAPPRILPPDKRLTDSQFLASRMRQIADLQRIEAYNERYLMKETQFPRATEHNEDVEKWADAVMRNWRVMCGPSWRDEELGHGGKGVVARGVLDILYRAATKTYHSTQILRHLFTVHASLAEFDLAFKAFDSYVEIVTRGKDRAEKSGNTDHTQDDDDIVLRTSAEAIRILCRFGGRREAEKAKAIGERMDKWLKQRIPVVPASRSSREDEEDRTETAVSPRAMAISYSAIAMSEAHWARATYDAKLRVELQRNAIINFEKSLDPKLEDSQNVETMYSHALLLAEAREIPGATKLAKQALALLAPNSIPALGPDGVISVDEGAAVNGNYVSERRSVPLCHLLALLLTSRSEYEKAVDVCDHAFKQFRDPANLYGAEESDQFKSDHLNELSSSSFNEKAEQQKRRGIVDRMEAFERESLLQIKMTELSLIQSIEGTNAAVESSDQLLALFARMFGDPSTAPTHPPAMNSFSSPPKTAKSFRESILGRSSASKRLSFRPKSSMAPSSTSVASRPSTMATYTTAAAPTIQVIEEEGQDSQQNGEKESHHHHLLQHKKRHTPRPQSSWSESAKLKKRRSHSDESRPFTADGPNDTSPSAYSPPPPVPSIQTTTNAHDFEYHAISSNEEQPATQKFPHIAHNLSLEEEPPPAGQHEQPPHQDVRLPAPFPGSSDMPYYAALEPKFPPLQERRHKISLLVQVWLFIAGLYTRADMYDDAEGAVDEAHKLVQDFEVEVSKRDPSIRAFGERGWGGGKSVEGLWGDVWAEVRFLLSFFG